MDLKLLFSISLFLFCVVALPMGAFADTKFSTKHMNVELVSDSASVKPGRNFRIGIKFMPEAQWHVYWLNPGDSGEAPRITWVLPLGIKADEINWPVPEKIVVSPLADFGYSSDLLLASTVNIPTFLSEKPFEIKAKVKWLVCKEVCVPGSADLDLILPVTNSEPLTTASRPLFQSTRDKYPLPLPKDWKINTTSVENLLKIKITGPTNIKTATFFPFHPLQIDNFADQKFQNSQLTIKKSDQRKVDVGMLEGVLKLDSSSYIIRTPILVSMEAAPLYLMILFAFVGGLLLNLMPCVFPVLSMKVFGFLKNVGEEKEKIRAHALFYTLGILVSFWVLVTVLLVLKSGGEHLGWGFQLQSPEFVATLAAILFLFGLNLVGVFEIGSSFMGVGNALTRRQGVIGDFFTGVLATVVATPCTAPFMGSAVGFALSQNAAISFLIFTSLALGLAAPYVFLAFNPTVGRLLPRPGPWMETLKQITAFLIFATVVWLISVVALQTSPSYLIILLSSLFLMGVAAWILHRWGAKKFPQSVAFLIILLSLFLVVTRQERTQEALKWEEFSPSKLESLRSGNKSIFIDYTAAWCISCKVNELVVFNSKKVLENLERHNVVLMKADWTNHDSLITQALADLGRSGVPTYVIYEGSKDPVVLPEVITPNIVINALDKLTK